MADRSFIACGNPGEPHREYELIPHDKVPEYLAAGWALSKRPMTCHHGRYSALMVRPYDPEK